MSDTVTYAPATTSTGGSTGGGCSGGDPLNSVCSYTATTATANKVLVLEPELSGRAVQVVSIQTSCGKHLCFLRF